MKVIQGVINKATSPDILKNYLSLLDSLSGCFETNIPYDVITSLVKQQLDEGGSWQVLSLSLIHIYCPFLHGSAAYLIWFCQFLSASDRFSSHHSSPSDHLPRKLFIHLLSSTSLEMCIRDRAFSSRDCAASFPSIEAR